MISEYTNETDQGSFFGAAIDIALIATAIISSLISLTIPYLYYLKKECREHPTVLLANIAILQATANYNIILMAYNMYAFENFLNIKNIFHYLTFFADVLPTEEDFCETNYLIYMYLELLSISFHICYSIDLFLTLKYPFLSGKKRRKIYYVFSLLYPVAVILLSVADSQIICDTLEVESIYYVPKWFLYSLFLFAIISIINILLSFMTSSSHCKIRQSYIRLHRTTLFFLLLTWVCPIWNNIYIHFQGDSATIPPTVNILAFFSIVSSSGVVTVTRIIFDSYIRRKIFDLFTCRRKKVKREHLNTLAQEEYLQLDQQSAFQEDVWNLPLSGAMSEFQSQEVVHNIIQVVCQACSPHHRGRQSIYTVTSDKFIQQSIYRNTVHVERQSQTVDDSFLNGLFNQRREELLEHKDPNQCDQHELKEMCRRNKKFEMVCTTQAKNQNNQQARLKQKTVRIKTQINQLEVQAESIQLDIKVCSYSHRVFESLRLQAGFNAEQLQKSLDLEKNMQQIKKAKESLGASGSFFFFSFDNRLVIKTISQEEKQKMVQLLPLYHQHLKFNEHSLFTRIYGIFAVQISQISKIYFLMMENSLKLFLDNNIQYRTYDLKGSTIQREVSDPDAPVLKDINYFKSADCFIFMTKRNKVRFLDILSKDLELLRKFNIMDYSLLLAVGRSKNKRRSKLPTVNQYDLGFIQNYRYIHELQSATRRLYSMSLIDFLQEFNLQKKMELWLKRIFKGGGDISSVGTDTYLLRFTKFIRRIIVTFQMPRSMPVRKMSNSSKNTSYKEHNA